MGHPRLTLAFSRVWTGSCNSTRAWTVVLLQYHPAPPVLQALGRSRGPSNPYRDASSRTCGYLGGATSAAQGRAAREVDLATALPASICTTPTRYRSSATACLVVIPWSITAVILVYAVENFCFCYPIFLHHHGANYGAYFSAAIRSTSMLFSLMADGASPSPTFLVASHIFINLFPTVLEL